MAESDLPKDGPGSFGFWQKEAARSKAFLASLAKARGWDENTQAYLGKSLDEAPTADTIVVPKDFAKVEGKSSLLFFQVPEVTLTAKQPGVEAALPLFQAVLNAKLGPDDVNAGALMQEVLFDVLCPSGIGFSKIGYEAEQDGEAMIPQPAMDPSGQPIVDPMTGQPAMADVPVPNIVRERYFWERIPVKQALIPADFHGSDFDKAPWLGFRFKTDLQTAARTYQVEPDALKPAKSTDDDRIKADIKHEESGGDQVEGTEIWFQAARYLPNVVNGDLYYQLVWFAGMDAPAICRPSPYQRVENGRLVGGMKGSPIHVLTLRYVSDQAVPPSDVSMSRPLVDELNEGRTQMVRQRKRTNPIMAYDPTQVPKDAIDKIVNGDIQEAIPIPGFGTQNQAAGEVRRASFPRENFSFADYTNADIDEVWAMGANQQGVQSRSKQTATEASIQQTATQTRMKREQTQVARWFVAGVQKLGSLIQLFADEPDYVEVVGPEGSKALQTWDKTAIQGRFAYTAKPDSTLQMDAAFDKKNALDEYQFFRKDPLVNPTYLLQRTARRIGADPAQFIVQPQPPPPPPPPPPPLPSLKGEDLNPMMPQYANVYALLTAHGVTGLQPPLAVPPAILHAAQQATPNTEHGGMQPQAEPLNKHQADQTGKLDGMGMAGAAQ